MTRTLLRNRDPCTTILRQRLFLFGIPAAAMCMEIVCRPTKQPILGSHHLITLSVTSDRLETHQEPNGDAIDIIGLSAQYIRAQISDSNATESIISQNKNSSHHQVARRPHGQHRHGHSHGHSHGQISPRRSYSLDPRAVDGPIQCGEGSPCKDGSCCNKDGKW